MTAPNDEARRAREAERKKEARALSGHALITGPEAAAMCGITTKHIRTLEAQGDFPARVRIGPNRVAWRLRDLEEWIDARIQRHSISEENRRGRWAAADEQEADHG